MGSLPIMNWFAAKDALLSVLALWFFKDFYFFRKSFDEFKERFIEKTTSHEERIKVLEHKKWRSV